MNRPLLITDCDEVLRTWCPILTGWLWANGTHAFRYLRSRPALRGSDDRAGDRVIVTKNASGRCSTFFLAKCIARLSLVSRRASEALGRSARSRRSSSFSPTWANGGAFSGGRPGLARHGIRHEVVASSGGKGVARTGGSSREWRGTECVVERLAGPNHASVAKHASEVQTGCTWSLNPRLGAGSAYRRERPCGIEDWPTAPIDSRRLGAQYQEPPRLVHHYRRPGRGSAPRRRTEVPGPKACRWSAPAPPQKRYDD